MNFNVGMTHICFVFVLLGKKLLPSHGIRVTKTDCNSKISFMNIMMSHALESLLIICIM